MARILIIGAAGFLGSNFAHYFLQNQDNFVIGIDNLSSSKFNTLYPLLKYDRFIFLEHDMTDYLDENCDFIYNFSGSGDKTVFLNDKYEYITNQIEIIKNILKLSSENGAKPFFVSEFHNYIQNNNNIFEYYNYENLMFDLVNQYSIKCQSDYKILRLDNVFGQYFNINDNRFIFSAIKNALSNINIDITYDIGNYYTYIDDICDKVNYLSNNYTDKKFYTISSKNLKYYSEIASEIIKLTNSNSKIVIKNSSKIKPDFDIVSNFECSCDFQNSLLKTIKYAQLIYFS